jgi:hypothetical protein
MEKIRLLSIVIVLFISVFGFGQTPAPTYYSEPASVSYTIKDGDCSFFVNPNKFSTQIRVETSAPLTSFNFSITYNSSIISLDTNSASNGVQSGLTNISLAVNNSQPGSLKISGIDLTGVGVGSTTLVTISWIAVSEGTTTIQTDTDPNNPIAIVPIFIATNVNIKRAAFGDVNVDNKLDIVDALLDAQYYVGLKPSNFNSCLGDANRDGKIDIIDALRIAQYYVGLIPSPAV